VKKLFDKHVEEEENEVLPELEAKLGQDGIRKLGDLVERRIRELEGETVRRRGAAGARRGQRTARTRAARSGRAASGARGRGAKAGRTTQKSPTRKKAVRTNGSRDTNGNKPRRGESTSRH
jgi:hypothetical protein